MKNRFIKRICAIIVSACLGLSVVSVVGIASSTVTTAVTAIGSGNYLVNGGFEADAQLSANSGDITTGWSLSGATASLSADAYEGEQALKIDINADTPFTLTPNIADENGNISGFKEGIYTFSCYLKGNSALLFKTWDSNGIENTKIFNENCDNITDWQKFSVSISVPKSGVTRFQIASGDNTLSGQSLYVDNASLRMNTAVINGDFEGADNLPEVDDNIIVNGDFEQGYVTSKQVGGFTDKGDETTKIFCSADGSDLKENYYFNTFTTQGIKAALSTDSDYVYSGSRSLKLSNVIKDGLNNRFNLYPESATERLSINGQRVYFMDGLESGTYIFEVYVKIPTADTSLVLNVYDWSTASAKAAVNTKDLTADSNGWYCIKHKFVVGSDGHLGFSLYSSLGNTNAKEIYLDNMSLVKREEATDDNLILNGGFEQGDYITSQIGGYPAKGDVSSKIFSGKDDVQLGFDYYFNTFTSQAIKGAVNTEADYIHSGRRSLKLSNMIGNYNSRFNIVPETATVAKKISGQTTLFISGMKVGNYTAEVYVKTNTEKNTAPVILYTFNWANATRTAAASTKNITPDQNGWYHLTADITVGSDGYLGFALSCEFGSSDAMDVYIDDFKLYNKNSASGNEPDNANFETDIPYWNTSAPDGGKSVLSLNSEDTVSGKTALKIMQNEEDSIIVSPQIMLYPLGTGYNMLAFWAKGVGKINVSLKTTSESFTEEFSLYEDWHKYTIRDIEIKSGEKIENISFTVTGSSAFLDAVQFYTQVGPAKLTESFQIVKGTKYLCLPSVADGYAVNIKSVSDASVISKNGKITQPDYNTSVDVVLSVTNINDETDTADSHVLTVNVDGKYGEIPKEEYKPMTLTDRETNISVIGIFDPNAKFRAMEISSDNQYYEEMLGDNECIGFYNTVITPVGGFSSNLKFKIPVDKVYNGEIITVVYLGESNDFESYNIKAENGFVTLETASDGFFMLRVAKEPEEDSGPKDEEQDNGDTTSTPENEDDESSTIGEPNEPKVPEQDDSTPESENNKSSAPTKTDKNPDESVESKPENDFEKNEPSSSENKDTLKPQDDSLALTPEIDKEKEPIASVEKADKTLSIRKLIDTTAIWVVIIIAIAMILIMIEITTTIIIRKKIKR